MCAGENVFCMSVRVCFISLCISIGEDVICLSVSGFFSVLVSVLFVSEIVFLLMRMWFFCRLKWVVY